MPRSRSALLSDAPSERMRQHFEKIGVAALVFVLCMTFWAFVVAPLFAQEIVMGVASRNWMESKGCVVAAYSLERSRSLPSSRYLEVSYAYAAPGNGTEIVSTRTRFGAQFDLDGDQAKADAQAQALYPKGRIVKVYFDPESPNRVALEKGLHLSTKWLVSSIIAFGSFLVVAGGCVVYGLREWSQISRAGKHD